MDPTRAKEKEWVSPRRNGSVLVFKYLDIDVV